VDANEWHFSPWSVDQSHHGTEAFLGSKKEKNNAGIVLSFNLITSLFLSFTKKPSFYVAVNHFIFNPQRLLKHESIHPTPPWQWQND
jgi:hypothetical protein